MNKYYIYIILLSLLIPTQNRFFEVVDSEINNQQIIRFNITSLESEIESISKYNKSSYSFMYYIEEGIDYMIDYEVLNDTIIEHSNIQIDENN